MKLTTDLSDGHLHNNVTTHTRRMQNEGCSFIIDPDDADSRSSNSGNVTQF